MRRPSTTSTVLALLLAALPLLGAAPPAAATTRVEGDDRYATAVEISRRLVPVPAAATGVQRVYVASGAAFPDALAAGAQAGLALSGPTPVLLVPPTGPLPGVVAEELRRLEPDRITVVGGPSAVSGGVFDQIRAFGTTQRLQGEDRYETASQVATEGGGSPRSLFLATGLDFPDALSGAAAAGGTSGRLLLTDPRSLPEATARALRMLLPGTVYVLGDQISEATIAQVRVQAPGTVVVRLAGDDRYATSAEVARAAFPSGAEHVVIATGTRFPDALAGGPLAAATGAPLLLVRRDCAPTPAVDAVAALGARSVTVLGGTDTVSGAAAALQPCR